MGRKRYKPEEIASLLRLSDVLHSQGMTMSDAIRQIGVSEVTFYRWRKEYGGQLCRLKELEKENER
ncbi:MAG: IS3 family transposase, partial [Rhodospirillaceae bacterium]|nr:IS3 family transposase [Rhodospirillaceae bacterium]